MSIGTASAFIVLAAVLSFGTEPERGRPAWHLRGTIAPDAAPVPSPLRDGLPAAAKRA